MTKVEIEKELEGKGDYVKIDNITRFLKENPPVDIKRFVYLKLVEIYERRAMFSDAADIYARLTEIPLTSKDKTEYFTKQVQCYVKAGFFDKADLTLKKIVSEIEPKDRAVIMISIREFYKNQALTYEKEKRKSKAIQTYEKMLTLNFSDAEKEEISKKLLSLYKDLGMVSQYMALKNKTKQ